MERLFLVRALHQNGVYTHTLKEAKKIYDRYVNEGGSGCLASIVEVTGGTMHPIINCWEGS